MATKALTKNMSILFIILALLIIFAVVIYIIGVKRGESQQTVADNKEIREMEAEKEEEEEEEDDEV